MENFSESYAIVYIKYDHVLLPVCFLDCLTPSLVPVLPFPEPPTHPISYEAEEFLPENSSSYPYTTYTNTLYVYPLHLKYDTQKCFAKVGETFIVSNLIYIFF